MRLTTLKQSQINHSIHLTSQTMKKFITLFLFGACTIICFAEQMKQIIVTECGTYHSIPSNSTADEACRMVDYWTAVDC